MKTQSLLFTKPLKELPSRLIYKSPVTSRAYENLNGCETYVYTYKMFDTKTKEIVGTMKAGPVLYQNKDVQIYPIQTPYKSYFIYSLDTADSGYGYGSDFINLAMSESKKYNCQGRIHLTASRMFSPRRPPHLFYRKLGFNSISPFINQTMDFYISLKTQLPLEFADNIEMYLPVKTNKTKTSVSKIVNFFKEKFTKK